MVSKTALEDIEEIEADGGRVSARDVIRLNAVGLRLEKTADFRLASLPRIAVLGDVILRQPTIAQDMFIDDALNVLSADPATVLALESYVLAHPDEKFVKLKHPYWFALKCKAWVRNHLGSFTATEVRRAVDYCLYGTDPKTGERPVYMTDKDDHFEVPDSPLSKAVRLYFSATSLGIDSVAALRATSPQLEAMIERAWLLNKLGEVSDEEKMASAEYFATLDEIKRKAEAERDGKKDEV